MLVNKKLIEETFSLCKKEDDYVTEFAYRYKTSPKEKWSLFKPYSTKAFQKVYNEPVIDGTKLKFKYTTLYINGRYCNT